MNKPLRLMQMWVMLLFAVSIATVHLSSAETTKLRERTSHPSEPQPEPYMRISRSDSNLVQLQIAVRKFLPARRSGPIIWLAGASHIGDSNYFRALQKHLDDQTLVLFEGISDRHDKSKEVAIDEEKPATDAEAAAPESSLQSTLAESLGLVFQLKAINYRRPHFRNSDLSIQQLQRLMQDSQTAAGTGGDTRKQFERLLQIMDEGTFLGGLAKVVVTILGSSPKLQAITKLALIETLGQIQGDISQMKGLPPDLSALVKVLIQARNEAVVDDLKAEMKRKARPRSISIFYGAGHMQDLEQRLKSELKYRPAEQFWLTAFSVNLKTANVTDAEMETVRSLVKWQMDQLQP